MWKWRIVNFKNMSSEMGTGNEQTIKGKLMTSWDVSQYTRAQLQFIDFFEELSDIAHCNEGIAKEMKILKITGEFPTTTILRICHHLINYSTFLQIILCHPCSAITRTFLKELREF